MKVEDLKVGDVIFALNRRSNLLKEVTITKIGRKYIHISGIASGTKIEKESLRIYDAHYGRDYSYDFFLSMQDYRDEVEKRELTHAFYNLFDSAYRCKISLEKLRLINKILNDGIKVVVPKNQRKVFPEANEIIGDCECGHIVADCDNFCSRCGSELKWGKEDAS